MRRFDGLPVTPERVAALHAFIASAHGRPFESSPLVAAAFYSPTAYRRWVRPARDPSEISCAELVLRALEALGAVGRDAAPQSARERARRRREPIQTAPAHFAAGHERLLAPSFAFLPGVRLGPERWIPVFE